MALQIPELDDRSYAQLLDVLKSHLPGEEWSDHNPSDPGIALLELLTWLGEMLIYRANRVPATHRDKFLKLLADPPVPVTVALQLELKPARTTDFVVPAGLRFATDYKHGRRFIFESYERATLPKPELGKPQVGTLTLRATRFVSKEVLGVSNGRPNQVFRIQQGPVLLDFDNSDTSYLPNPTLSVGGAPWTLKDFLLTEASKVVALPPEHFMVEEFENQVRFGDESFGGIPPVGAKLELTYQVLDGPLESPQVLVPKDTLEHFLNPERVTGLVSPEELVPAGNSDAIGGEGFFTPEERMRRALAEFRDPTRLVTAADFERVVLEDFNAFQDTFGAAQDPPLAGDQVERVVAVMNGKPPLNSGVVSPGHVTLLVIPRFDPVLFEAGDLTAKAGLVLVTDALEQHLLRFLESRRLITTRLHVTGVALIGVVGQVVAVVEPQRNTADMEQAIRDTLVQLLSLVPGETGPGWPLGRAVRRSQLYSALEAIPGVDHVESLSLSPANAAGDVLLNARQLPVWDVLQIQVKRG